MSEMKKVRETVTTNKYVRDEHGNLHTAVTVEHFELDESSDLLKVKAERTEMQTRNTSAWHYLNKVETSNPLISGMVDDLKRILDGKPQG